MTEQLQPYLDIILDERNWSWTLLGIVYLLAGLIIRGWFLGPLIARAKELEKPYWHEIKKNYLRDSFLGWVFFLVPLILIIVLWYQKGATALTQIEIFILIFASFSYLLSVLLHIQAFGIATIKAIRESLKTESSNKIF